MTRPTIRALQWLAAATGVAICAWLLLAPPTPLDRKYSRIGRRTSGAMESLDLWAAQSN